MDPQKPGMNTYVLEDAFRTLQGIIFQPYLCIPKKNYRRVDLNDKCFEADLLS